MCRLRFSVREVDIGRYDRFRSLSNCMCSVRSSSRRGRFCSLQEEVDGCDSTVVVLCWVSYIRPFWGWFCGMGCSK